MTRERIDEWALLRGLCFLAVVMQHCIGEYIYRSDIMAADSIMLGMVYHFTRFGTLTFVFLAGAILFYQYGDGRSYRSALVRRIGDIYVPFVLWTLIYWVVVQLADHHPLFGPGTWQSILTQLFAPTNGYHLWFVIMIFQFYLLFPLFRWLFRQFSSRWLDGRTEGRQQRIVIGMLLLLAIMYGWLMWMCYNVLPGWSLQGAWQALLEHRTSEFPFYFFYFVLGGICGSAIQRWREMVIRLLPWSTIVFLMMYIWLGYDLLRHSTEAVNLNVSTYLKPTTFVIVVSHMLLIYGLALLLSRQNHVLVRFLKWCGRYSFGGYLSHALILAGVASLTRPLVLTGMHLPVTLLSFAFVAPAAILLTSLISRLPGGQWLTGSAGKKSRKRTAPPGNTVVPDTPLR
ncbi:acyltransferase [Paenibacillus wulumuqiensis]|uniref:acyltransferase n=1 Tax=Paenibacillus wulumuqiensis TaxID=1567107 RepID=UPI000619ED29|nr:acyltransferase [Paenibacillus wulumuqiensis]